MEPGRQRLLRCRRSKSQEHRETKAGRRKPWVTEVRVRPSGGASRDVGWAVEESEEPSETLDKDDKARIVETRVESEVMVMVSVRQHCVVSITL